MVIYVKFRDRYLKLLFIWKIMNTVVIFVFFYFCNARIDVNIIFSVINMAHFESFKAYSQFISIIYKL